MSYTSFDPIKNEYRRIQRLIELCLKSESPDKPPPRGSLIVENRGDSTYCYECHYRNGSRTKKTYLGMPGSEPVRRFCAEKYRKELLHRLKANHKLIQGVEERLADCSHSAIFSAIPPACQRVSSEAYIDERYEELKSWASVDFARNTAPFPDTENFAIDGMRVRSKGECIIYNLLFERHIPFRYDSLLTITDPSGFSKTLSPDFMIQCYDGSFVIIEHLGWIGDKRYALNYGEKCYWYLQKGFVPGRNLLVTSDDARGGTDSASISNVIDSVEKLFWGY